MTERCVFRLVAGSAAPGHGQSAAGTGLELVEIAPGIDLERDVLAHMDFLPAISPHLKLMDAALFRDEPMNLRERLLATPLADRFELDRAHRMLFINFEGLAVGSSADISDIERQVTALLAPLEERVAVVVNYDSFHILPPLVDDYAAMVVRLTERFYSRVTRYGTGGFLKAKLEAGRA